MKLEGQIRIDPQLFEWSSLNVCHRAIPPTSGRVSQLPTHNKGILVVPIRSTPPPPPPSPPHLHPPLSGFQAPSKANAIMDAGSGYNRWMKEQQANKITVAATPPCNKVVLLTHFSSSIPCLDLENSNCSLCHILSCMACHKLYISILNRIVPAISL